MGQLALREDYAYHAAAGQDTHARPDLKLYLSAYGPVYDGGYDKVPELKKQRLDPTHQGGRYRHGSMTGTLRWPSKR